MCTDIVAPKAELLLKKGNLLVVKFSETVIFDTTNFNEISKFMNVTIEGIDCNLNWELQESFTTKNTRISLSQQQYSSNILHIQTKPKCSLPAGKAYFQVKFVYPTKITDSDYNALATSILKVKTQKFNYISDTEKAALSATGAAFDNSGIVTFIIMITISLVQSAAIGSFWSFVNMLQILGYVPAIQCFIPYNLEIFLTEYMSVKKVVFPFYLLPDFILNPARIVAAFITAPLNNRFLMVGYGSLSFIFNFSEELSTWILLLFFYLLLRFLCFVLPEDKYFLSYF